MLLDVVAENSLPFTMVPVLIQLTQELAKDKKLLANLSMDRTSASYKMNYGLRKTIESDIIQDIRGTPFSLNIDEATSNNNKHVLSILVSYYSQAEKQIVLEHIAAVEVVRVCTDSILEKMEALFEKHEIPWDNLVSMLMDSCAVMWGSKNGLEKKIREKAPKMVDIDGDICHHIHNASKKFCQPFKYWIEDLFNQLYNDHKWSVDLKEMLAEICHLIGLKFTVPERFVRHRWLSACDVAVGTLRMLDAYKVLLGTLEGRWLHKIFPKFPKILNVFQSATVFSWIVVLCRKNRFVNVCFVFVFIDDFFNFVSVLLYLVSFRFLFYNHPFSSHFIIFKL